MKCLPTELLPTFWNAAELDLLEGTTLASATDAKLKSLFREFERFRSATENIEWCKRVWWDEVEGILDFDDWKQVDAMYRSRALEIPGIGDCMVPFIDISNHASGDQSTATYDADQGGNALLVLREGKELYGGSEIYIT